MHAPPSWPRGALGRRRDAPLPLPTAPHVATRVGRRRSPETPSTPRTARWARRRLRVPLGAVRGPAHPFAVDRRAWRPLYAPSRFPTPRFDGQSAWFVASRALKTASRSWQGCSRPFQANCSAFSSLFPAACFGQNAPNAAAFSLTAIT